MSHLEGGGGGAGGGDATAANQALILADVGDASAGTLGSIYGILGNPATTITAQLTAIAGYVDTEVAGLLTALQGGDNATNRAAGKVQIFATTIDLHQGAATYDLATATTQNCLIESLVFSTPLDLSDDAALTGITIQTDTTTAQTFIDAAGGLKALLTAEAQVNWVGSVLLRATDKIQLTIVGGTATADPTTCPVIIKYRAIVNGGYLA